MNAVFTFLAWYVMLSLVGWAAFPLAYRLLPALPDRGYTFSRALGLLLWGYVFWLLASLGMLRNDTGSMLFALLALMVLSAWALFRKSRPGDEVQPSQKPARLEIFAWLSANRIFVLNVEILFLVAFAGWTLVRAANPEIFGTEKPMEVGFINAILRSPTLPPRDPWLSGYAISYYYFGYVLVAMLANLSGVMGSVAFNLGIGMIFALSALGAYGLVYNLLVVRNLKGVAMIQSRPSGEPHGLRIHARCAALWGPFLVLLVSNIEGFLEVMHARGSLPAGFWRWLDIQDLNLPSAEPFSWLPRLFGTGGWWWWRASRVLQDYDFAGNSREIIDEFPLFSFLLADLHPHVLVIPFAFLAMELALNLFLNPKQVSLDWFRRKFSHRMIAWGAVGLVLMGILFLWLGLRSLNLRQTGLGLVAFVGGGLVFVSIPPESRWHGLTLFTNRDSGERTLGIKLRIGLPDLLLCWVAIGGLAFLNTWDFPFYVALFAGAYVLRAMRDEATQTLIEGFRDFFAMGLVLGAGGVLVYLPFYLGFSSQAGGLLPNLIFPTRGAHLWVMFATLLVPLFAYLIWLAQRSAPRESLRKSLVLTIVGLLLLLALTLLLGGGILALPGVNDLFLGSLSASSAGDLFRQALVRRIINPGGWLTLIAFLGLTLGLLWPRQSDDRKTRFELSHADVFAILMMLLAALLVVGPEFFFLRDQFGWRMNTIFKFYYQAWLLWGIAAAYAASILWRSLSRWRGTIFRISLVLIMGMGLVYTVLGIWDKTHGFAPPGGWSLDGAAYLERSYPDDLAAIAWLSAAPDGVLVEAVGGSYSDFARASAFSGQPTVLGWPGHESQWRGGGDAMGSRQADIQQLYCTRDWNAAAAILKQYHVRYVYVGSLERAAYTRESCVTGLSEDKFSRHLQSVFQQGSVSVYVVPESLRSD